MEKESTSGQSVSRKGFIRLGAGTAAAVWLGACTTKDAGTPAAAAGQLDSSAVAGTATTMAPGLDTATAASTYAGDVVNLRYNDPFKQGFHPVWIHGKKAFHLNLGAVNQRPAYKIAEQYLVLREADYKEPTKTPDQFMATSKTIVGDPVFDSAPGDANYSPIWHNNWVLVPASYQANTLTSEEEVKKSGYKIISTPIWVN